MNKLLLRTMLFVMFSAYYSISMGMEFISTNTEEVKKRETQVERQLLEKEERKLIGRKFWYVPNTKAIDRISFSLGSGEFMSYFFGSAFRPTEATTFDIVDLKLYIGGGGDSSAALDRYIFEVKFPDGTTAYTAANAGQFLVTGLEYYIYKGEKSSLEKEYIYSEPPETVFAKERKAKDKLLKANAVAREKWNAKGGVSIGMTKAQALASNWGRPKSINKTTTSNGTHEQWVYGSGNYLYFENGELTSIQN